MIRRSRSSRYLILGVLLVAACGAEETTPPSCPVGFEDRDGDGFCSDADNCVDVGNPTQVDSDVDGVGDACDPNDVCLTHGGDADEDTVCQQWDNCTAEANEDQSDVDGDQLGDECDPVEGDNVCAGNGGDADDDDVCQAWDNCPDDPNAAQENDDEDALGDACDPTPKKCDDLGGDGDGDTVCNAVDNCPDDSNLNQLDVDNDGVGDVCDPFVPVDPSDPPCAGLGGDIDNDNYCGLYDNCPTVTNPSQADTDTDGTGDACDTEDCDGLDNDGDASVDEGFPDADVDGVADCVDACPQAPNVDTDVDGFLDCLDPCPADPDNDIDGDSICGDVDNCPSVANANNQGDKDSDGIGDVCDVEECDGISNDDDTQIDEGMPDADSDGICDLIDGCVNDPQNDVDADGFCADSDNCPLSANATQLDSDNDGWGDACDIDSPSACGAAASVNAPGAVPFPSGLQLGDMVADPLLDMVYVSVRSASPSHPNEIFAVHAGSSGGPSIAWSLWVGSDPFALAISADGSILYVALHGSGSVRMVNVGQRKACLSFPVADIGEEVLKAGDMDVLPSFPETVVISTRKTGSSPDFGGVRVYDNGVPRPVGTPGHTGARMITIASDSVVYGLNNASTESGFRELTISSTGIVQAWVQPLYLIGGTDIVHHDGLVYSTNGVIIDPTFPIVLGTLANASGPVAADSLFAEAYFATSSSVIAVYNTNTLTFERNIAISGFGGTPVRLARWGTNGLAMLTSGGLNVVTSGAGP